MPIEYEPSQDKIICRYANGVTAVLDFLKEPFGNRDPHYITRLGTCPVRFVGDEGWVETGDSGEIVVEPESLAGQLPDTEKRVRGLDVESHARNFFDSVKSRKPTVCNSSVMRHSHIACHAAALSWILGRKLRIDPATETFVDDDEANRLCSRPARELEGLELVSKRSQDFWQIRTGNGPDPFLKLLIRSVAGLGQGNPFTCKEPSHAINTSHRRDLLRAAAVGSTGLLLGPDLTCAQPPAEKLNVALIGVGGRGRWFVDTMPSLANVVALCDVNDARAGDAYQIIPQAKKFYDFRVMLEEMERQIDAVVIATPDNTHAVAAAMAMKMGKHVYCEKPLTHDLYEARYLRDFARQTGVATQLGNQGTASEAFRRALELIQRRRAGRSP